ncbi:MAG TPA: Crp/Fnr family transcriptional regulator [Kiloniellaceae bacterium]|nr:Crp/Fnr family transcriptional regulator [Kiloniellaceae bacterium]
MQIDPANTWTDMNVAENALVQKLSALIHLSAEEVDFLNGLHINRADVKAGCDFVSEGEEFRSSFVLRSGWALRYRLLKDGRRQIIGVILPGDFIGLNVNFRRTATYSVCAKTDCALAPIEPLRILEIHQRFPVLASALSWVTVREYSILAEHAVRLGRRTAYERLVHLMLELYHRLELIGLSEEHRFKLHISQKDLSDLLGLSTVHIHRTLRRLTADGLVSMERGEIRLKDIERLEEIADTPEPFLEDFAVL